MLQDLNQVASYSFLPSNLPDAQNTQKQKKHYRGRGNLGKCEGYPDKTKQKIYIFLVQPTM